MQSNFVRSTRSIMNVSSKALGRRGEIIAKNYLQKKGYQILAQNYIPKWIKKGRVEVDIVVKKGRTIIFVEVKSLSGNNNFLPEDKINFQKQRNIKKAAESYLLENKIPLDSKWQIDVISIIIDADSQKARVRHFENIDICP